MLCAYVKGSVSMPEKMHMPELRLTDAEDGQMVAVLDAPYRISVRRAEIPDPSDEEVRVKIKWVGICGSDVEAYRGIRAPEFLSTPARLGHEATGVIDKVGKNVIGLRIGDRVVLRYVWGAFAQYLVCKPFSVHILPDTIDLKEGSLTEVLPGILHAASLGDISPAKDVLIMGQGVSGLVMTQIVKLMSPRNLVVTDLFEEKLRLSRKYGATHAYVIPSPDTRTRDVVGGDFPNGFDVVIPCLLEGDGVVDAIDICAQNGRIILYGCIGTCNKPLDFFKVHRKRIDIFSTEPKRDIDNRRFWDESMRLVESGLVNTTEMVTHTFPLSRIQEAFKLREAHAADVIHVMIDCE